MDRDTAAALAEIKEGLVNLTAAVGLLARLQTIHGEQLTAIKGLLTPDKGQPQGPTTKELIEQMMTAQEEVAGAIAQRLADLGRAVQRVPAETARVLGDTRGGLAQQPR